MCGMCVLFGCHDHHRSMMINTAPDVWKFTMPEEMTIEIATAPTEIPAEPSAPIVVESGPDSAEIDRWVALESRLTEIETRLSDIGNVASDASLSAAHAELTAETSVADAAAAALEIAETVSAEPEPEPEPEPEHSSDDEAPNREHWFFADHPIKRG